MGASFITGTRLSSLRGLKPGDIVRIGSLYSERGAYGALGGVVIMNERHLNAVGMVLLEDDREHTYDHEYNERVLILACGVVGWAWNCNVVTA